MDQIFSIGKNLIGGGGDSGSSGLGGIGDALTLFKQLDRNGDGKITEDDFVLAIEKLGMGSIGETGVRQAFKQLDKNGNGTLEISEAISAYEKVKELFDKTGGSS